MRQIILAALLAGVLSGEGHAESSGAIMTGNKLLDYCSSPLGTLESGVCNGYVAAIYDVLLAPAAASAIIKGWFACIPPGATLGQLRDVVVAYLRNNPQHRHYGAPALAALALALAFPCR